MSEIYLEI